jgi:hypothetical protein
MVEEKKVYRILYEAELEIYGVDDEGHNYWKDNKPSDLDFKKAIKYDLDNAFCREDSALMQLNYWTSNERIKKLVVKRVG